VVFTIVTNDAPPETTQLEAGRSGVVRPLSRTAPVLEHFPGAKLNHFGNDFLQDSRGGATIPTDFEFSIPTIAHIVLILKAELFLRTTGPGEVSADHSGQPATIMDSSRSNFLTIRAGRLPAARSKAPARTSSKIAWNDLACGGPS
jgi:hypothetical protein